MMKSDLVAILALATLLLGIFMVIGWLQAKELREVLGPLALLERRCGLSGVEIDTRSREMPPAMRVRALLTIMPDWNVQYLNRPVAPPPVPVVEPEGPPSPTRYERLQ